MSVEARGYWTLVAAFLASRESPNTRSAYRRDLTVLAESLDVLEEDRLGHYLLFT